MGCAKDVCFPSALDCLLARIGCLFCWSHDCFPCVEVELEERRKAPQPNKGRGVNLRCGKRGEWGDRTIVHGSATHSNLFTGKGIQHLGIQVFALDFALYMY